MPYPIFFDGFQVRVMGLHERAQPVGLCGLVVGADDGAPPLIDRSLWQPFSILHETQRILDQDGLPYCHSYAATCAHELALAVQGRPGVKLSSTGLGSMVTGARKEGAGIDEVLHVLKTQGQPEDSYVPEYDYRRQRWQAQWLENAATHRLLEYWDCGNDTTFDGMASCLQRGFPVVFGCSQPFGPHAMCAVALSKEGGEWGVVVAQTWGVDWGNKGFGFLSERSLGGLRSYGAWAIRAAA